MPLTIKDAAAHAAAIGYTIRRTQDSELVGYRKGTGQNAPHAYFSDDPADVLATVCAMAVNEGADPVALAAASEAAGVRVVPVRAMPDCAQCGESFAPDAGGSDNCQDCNAIADAAANGEPMPQVDCKPNESGGVTTVDLTPTWESMAGAFACIFESGTLEGQSIARAEMRRAFVALDQCQAQDKARRALVDLDNGLRAICDLLETDSPAQSNAISSDGPLYSDSKAGLIAVLDALGYAHNFEPDAPDSLVS